MAYEFPQNPAPSTLLGKLWNKKTSEFAPINYDGISDPEAERHRIYALLIMSLVAAYWNGNKRGQDGEYPWRANQKLPNGTYKGDKSGDRYIGHNIAAIAVDAQGAIIDFDFNHNELFNSSAEHAEGRLVRRVFSLARVYDTWAVRPPGSGEYSNVLADVTVYTSLESCAQCSGIMTLGRVKQVVYLQQDPGQYSIGNILRAFDATAPYPIPGGAFGFRYFHALNSGFERFAVDVAAKPFFKPNVPSRPVDKSPSITSFLCTDEALVLYQAATFEFETLSLTYPNYQPVDPTGKFPRKTNAEVLTHAKSFLEYAGTSRGRRGTPHGT